MGKAQRRWVREVVGLACEVHAKEIRMMGERGVVEIREDGDGWEGREVMMRIRCERAREEREWCLWLLRRGGGRPALVRRGLYYPVGLNEEAHPEQIIVERVEGHVGGDSFSWYDEELDIEVVSCGIQE